MSDFKSCFLEREALLGFFCALPWFPKLFWRDPWFPPLTTPHSPPLTFNPTPLSVGPSRPLSCDRVLTGAPNPIDFTISTLETLEEIIPFLQEDIIEATDEWNLALVSYSL